jgi:hypothetical protein
MLFFVFPSVPLCRDTAYEFRHGVACGCAPDVDRLPIIRCCDERQVVVVRLTDDAHVSSLNFLSQARK